MNWFVALTTGAGLGLVSFGGLWFTVRLVMSRQQAGLLWASKVVRLAVVALGLYGLSRAGADMVLAGLGGLWLARWALVRQLEGTRDVR
jgi:F1F0 ATPase subunit 2